MLSSRSLPNIEVEKIGSNNDGGYFVLVEYRTSKNWITIGLSFNADFENDLASRKCKVISFDHTTPGQPCTLHTSIKYMPLGWGDE